MKTEIIETKKIEIYNYFKHLRETDGGYGGSISKRVRERFNITSEQVSEILRELKPKQDANR